MKGETMKTIQDTISHIAWCNEYIEEYRKNHTFDPLAALSDTESKEQEMFTLCCNYIYGIENSLDKVNKAFIAERYGIANRERRTA